jgi:hypothetical protein
MSMLTVSVIDTSGHKFCKDSDIKRQKNSKYIGTIKISYPNLEIFNFYAKTNTLLSDLN